LLVSISRRALLRESASRNLMNRFWPSRVMAPYEMRLSRRSVRMVLAVPSSFLLSA